MKAFRQLPERFQNEQVRPYYDLLRKKAAARVFKRIFDIIIALLLLSVLWVPIVVLIVMVKVDSKGPAFFLQERVTTYGRRFKIIKFRTMVTDAESLGDKVTTDDDSRVTNLGRTLRKYRLDELPQVFNVLSGTMSIVGTRPEVPQYVEQYEDEYYATLLLPAGITSLASIMYKDEETLLKEGCDVDDTYIHVLLPEKMKYNLQYIKDFSVLSDFKLMFKTVKEVF